MKRVLALFNHFTYGAFVYWDVYPENGGGFINWKKDFKSILTGRTRCLK